MNDFAVCMEMLYGYEQGQKVPSVGKFTEILFSDSEGCILADFLLKRGND
jgi:hypothetical protein